MEREHLYQQLISYGESDVYPFHMPGHKRRALPFPNPYTIDITEIDGFDNLHHAEGLIREAEERAAKLYGADRSYYLVNGSTCGLLAAICAAARRGDKVLAARNCHKAVYHAISMQGLAAEFLYPAITRGRSAGTDYRGAGGGGADKASGYCGCDPHIPDLRGDRVGRRGDCGMLSCTRGGADCR